MKRNTENLVFGWVVIVLLTAITYGLVTNHWL
jgi:hypothetical protein